MSSAVAEIKKLNDQLSALRQENIVLKVKPTIFEYYWAIFPFLGKFN